MKEISDKERMDFLDNPNRQWTFWIGKTLRYEKINGNIFTSSISGPVFPGTSIREEIDKWIRNDKT